MSTNKPESGLMRLVGEVIYTHISHQPAAHFCDRLTKTQRQISCVYLELTTGEDLGVAAVKGQAENVGAMFSLQFHRLGPAMDGFLHVPQEHAAIVST